MSLELSRYGLCRVAAVSPSLRVADVRSNVAEIARAATEAAAQGAGLIVFPELSLCGHSCGDLFFDTHLRAAIHAGIASLLEVSAALGENVNLVVGAPLELDQRLYNCAVVLRDGEILGVVPKTYLPNYGEFYEGRHFSSSTLASDDTIEVAGRVAAFGTDLLFALPAGAAAGGASRYFGVEICEDLWAVQPPSSALAAAGALVVVNPSASPEQIGKRGYRETLVCQQSARCLSAYVYAGSGAGESSTDVVYSGHCLIAENGTLLAQGERFSFETRLTLADIDLELLEHERLRNTSFARSGQEPVASWRKIDLHDATDCAERAKERVGLEPSAASSAAAASLGLLRPNPALPFVPADESRRAENCEEIFTIQQTALARRLRQLGGAGAVIGVSGGLDSTLALLVCVRAFDALGLDRKKILAVTMPGFGTTARTRTNADLLMEALGVSSRTIPIEAAVRQHFSDIGHDGKTHDIVFENAQARERTQILMDLANANNALVVGTGDLSEAALGWSTYGGDHISMYHVNIGVPKTLVRYLVEWCAQTLFSGTAAATLLDIAATPISPELLPPDAQTGAPQDTEATVGPYELHDFFLYHFVRHGTRAQKIAWLAGLAFAGRYEAQEIEKWLTVFLRRFFTQQFKRSCLPDGPKVGSVALSPRGDWRMPSDVAYSLWLERD